MQPSIHPSISQSVNARTLFPTLEKKTTKTPRTPAKLLLRSHYTLLLCAAPVMLQLLLTEPAASVRQV
jgi:hypothetical protein